MLPKHKTQQEISDATGIGQTGDLSEYLYDLELEGFVERDYTWDTATGKV